MPSKNVGQPNARPAPTAPQTTRLPLLIVDDEPPILELLQETLADAGYSVLAASNGREALAIAQQTPLALVLTDVMMPHMDGNQLCERLRAELRTQHLPILLMTATRYGISTGAATATITKPFDLDALVTLVRRYYPAGDERSV
jgi:CheY-like chemotaxis protein